MTKGPTIKQKRAVKDTLDNIGRKKPKTKQEIMLGAGYSAAIAKNPQIIEESKGWAQLMEEYLPENLVAKTHLELFGAATIGHYEFYGKTVEREVMESVDPDDAEDDDDEAPKKKKRPRKVKKTVRETDIISDEDIKILVESVPGCKLIYIKRFQTGSKTAYFSQPDNRSRKDAIDMAYELRGTYAPEKTVNLNLNANGRSNPKVREIAKKYETELKSILRSE